MTTINSPVNTDKNVSSNPKRFEIYFSEFKKELSNIIILFAALALALAFKDLIQGIITDTIVKKVVDNFSPTILFDWTTILLLIIAIVYFINNLSKGLFPTFHSIIVAIFLIAFYCLIIRTSSHYTLNPFILSDRIFYLDVIFAAIWLWVMRYRTYQTLTTNQNNPSLLEDIFKTGSPDLFGRDGIAQELSSIICNSISEQAVGISIVGRWGTGKTSFMHMVKSKLNDENEIIEFNPWRVTESKRNIEIFFESLSLAVSKYDRSAKSSILEYASFISEVDDDTWYSKLVKATIGSFYKKKDLYDRFAEVNQSIALTGKRFIIFC